jgi:hypothetical protein
VRNRWFVIFTGLLAATAAAAAQPARNTAPETFTANAHVTKAGTGGMAGTLQIHIERYTPEADRKMVESALKTGGYPAFVPALRKAPDVGYVQLGDQKTAIRWARETKTDKGRTITVVTEKPVLFVGGAAVDAKSRAGYEVAVIQMTVDDVGLGQGSMAAAARVKPGGPSGVQIDDYAEQPIKLVTVTRKIS